MRPVNTGEETDRTLVSGIRAYTDWQFRIMDLATCVARTKLCCGDVQFNLELSDPLERYATDKINWQPLTGEWTVRLGTASEAKRGFTPNVPVLKASIGAFSRLWGGGRTAHGLATTDDLSAPQNLLDQLDEVLQLPSIQREWPF